MGMLYCGINFNVNKEYLKKRIKFYDWLKNKIEFIDKGYL